jgi:hypothetical protein
MLHIAFPDFEGVKEIMFQVSGDNYFSSSYYGDLIF